MHGRYVTFQMAEVAVSRQMFQEILSLIARLRVRPAPARIRCDGRRQQRCASKQESRGFQRLGSVN
jgi:hypothetical protein